MGREIEEEGRGGSQRGRRRRGDGLGAGFPSHGQNGDLAEEAARIGAVGRQEGRREGGPQSLQYNK